MVLHVLDGWLRSSREDVEKEIDMKEMLREEDGHEGDVGEDEEENCWVDEEGRC